MMERLEMSDGLGNKINYTTTVTPSTQQTGLGMGTNAGGAGGSAGHYAGCSGHGIA